MNSRPSSEEPTAQVAANGLAGEAAYLPITARVARPIVRDDQDMTIREVTRRHRLSSHLVNTLVIA